MEPLGRDRAYEAVLESAREQIHDISQPVTALLCQLELGRILGTEEALRDAVTTGVAEATRLASLVQTLRDTVARGLASAKEGGAS
jgi:hypothetical protein